MKRRFAPPQFISKILPDHDSWLMRALMLFCILAPFSQSYAAPPAMVAVGTHINRINEINLKESKFEVDFYVWFVWTADGIKPGETFEVVNGHIQTREASDIHDIDGGHYACYRVEATVIKEFNLFKYPRDRHQLTIEIEDATPVGDIVYTPDVRNSTLSPDFFVPGFRANGATFEVGNHVYDTNYGDPKLASDTHSAYSRFTAGFEIRRPSSATAFKLYIGVFTAALIGFISLLARADQTEERFGLGSAALFAAIATQFVIATNMPETNILTVPDLVCIATILSVFLTLLNTVAGAALCHKGKEKMARKIELVMLVCLPVTYFGLCFYWILS